MGRRLAVFSDGTGNSAGSADKTNVWRLFQALDTTQPDQLAYYDDGVGTSSVKFLALLGGVFGWGLKRNVIDLYKFLCRNHQDGDEIYAFGFSRGAFTIRMLVDLVDSQGLAPFRSEEELHANAVLAYRRFRAQRFPGAKYLPFVAAARRLRDLLLWPFTRRAAAQLKDARRPPIKFLGLWDTVAAYGMPIDELRWGISHLVWPMVNPDRKLSKLVERACHALSLDDERSTFHPVLFDESDQDSATDPGTHHRITQVWFAGVHADVGGGYPEAQLSLVSLDWMISQLTPTGIRFDAGMVQAWVDNRSAFARLHDSRSGLAAYYRYHPRSLDMGRDRTGHKVLPLVHGSVIRRMGEGSDAYAPITLPHEFLVLAPDGSLLPVHEGGSTTAATRSATHAGDVQARTDALAATMADLNHRGDPYGRELVEQVADTVWWRRVVYFFSLASLLGVLALPWTVERVYGRVLHFFGGRLGEHMEDSLVALSDHLTRAWQGSVGLLIDRVEPLLPGVVTPWLHALQAQPVPTLAALSWAGLMLALGRFLAQRVHDRAWFAWHPSARHAHLDWAQESETGSLRKGAVFTVLAGLAAVMARWQLAEGLGTAVAGLTGGLCLAGTLFTLWRWRRLGHMRRCRQAAQQGTVQLKPTPTLAVARWLRRQPLLFVLYRVCAERVIPIALVLGLLAVTLGVAFHGLSRGYSALGADCRGAPRLDPAAGFDPKSLCVAVGDPVPVSGHYLVSVEPQHLCEWKDKNTQAGATGVLVPGWGQRAFGLLKRRWGARYYQPIVRVGADGNRETVLDSDEAPARHRCGHDDIEVVRTAAATVQARAGEQIYLYLNDVVLPVPYLAGYFYGNNQGSAKVTVTPLTWPEPAAASSASASGSVPVSVPAPAPASAAPR